VLYVFLVASICDVSDCNQYFLQEHLCSCACLNTRVSTHGARPHQDLLIHWRKHHTTCWKLI